MASYDEASRCPKCNNVGSVDNKRTINRNETLITFECKNKVCIGYLLPWEVLVLPDGSIPEPVNFANRQKQYVGFDDDDNTAQMFRDYAAAVDEQSRNNGEIRY